MLNKEIAFKMKLLSQRAMERRNAQPAIKTNVDVKVENDNFLTLKKYIYEDITKRR